MFCCFQYTSICITISAYLRLVKSMTSVEFKSVLDITSLIFVTFDLMMRLFIQLRYLLLQKCYLKCA